MSVPLFAFMETSSFISKGNLLLTDLYLNLAQTLIYNRSSFSAKRAWLICARKKPWTSLTCKNTAASRNIQKKFDKRQNRKTEHLFLNARWDESGSRFETPRVRSISSHLLKQVWPVDCLTSNVMFFHFAHIKPAWAVRDV